MTINYQKRLDLASRIAYFFIKNKDVDPTDCCWLVGMVCDTSMNDEKLYREILHTKENFPEYSSILNWKDVVYCAYGYSGIEGDDNHYVQKIFMHRADAEKYMEEQNKGRFKMILCIEEEEVN